MGGGGGVGRDRVGGVEQMSVWEGGGVGRGRGVGMGRESCEREVMGGCRAVGRGKEIGDREGRG